MRVLRPAASRRSSSPSSRRRCSSASSRRPSTLRERSARSRPLHVRHRARSNRAAATPPGTRRPARTASTRSCRRTGGRGRDATSATRTREATPANQEKVAAGKMTSAVPLARQLATGRLLVADGLEPDHRLVGARDALRGPGHAPTTPRRRRAQSPARPGAGSGARQHYSRGEPERSPTARHLAIGAVSRLRGWRSPLRDEGRGEGDVHVHGSRDHLVRTGRSDPRQGHGCTVDGKLRQDGRPPQPLVRRPLGGLQQGLGQDRHAHARASRSSATAGHPMVAIDEFVVEPARRASRVGRASAAR